MFSKLSSRDTPSVKASDRFAWYRRETGGESQKDLEWHSTCRWLNENLPPEYARDLANFLRPGGDLRPGELLSQISSCNAAAIVDLLYPRTPGLFLNSQMYDIFPLVSAGSAQLPFARTLLQSCDPIRTARLSAACLFAVTGAATCLEALLDLGVDPNGLDTPESWSYLQLRNDQILPVSPMDCAQLAGQEDCRLVLELFGGVSLHENLPDQDTYQI